MVTKFSGVILILILALSIFVFGHSVALGQLQTAVVLPVIGQIIQTPMYIVWSEGGVYYVNNSYGIVESSSDAFNALNYASSTLTNGGIIYLENGIYQIKTWNVANPNIRIYGQSWNTEIIALNSNMNSPVILVTGNNCTINNLFVDGNLPYQSNGFEEGISIYSSYNSVEHVWVNGTYDSGIILEPGSAQNGYSGLIPQYNTIYDCLVSNVHQSGIVMYGNSTGENTQNNTVSATTVLNSGLDGIFLSGVDYCTVNNSTINGAGDSAFEIQGGAGICNNGGGITNHSAIGNSGTAIEIYNSTNPAILIDGNNNYPVSGTTILNFNVNYTVKSGTADGLLLQGNVIGSNIGYGIINNTAGNGIDVIANSTNNNIHNITVLNSGVIGAKVDLNSGGNIYDSITVVNSNSYGFDVEPNCINNIIENSATINSNNIGIWIQSPDCSVQNCYVNGTTNSSIYNNGIYVESNNCTISGNTVNSPIGDGVNVNGVNNQVLNNNISNVPRTNAGISLSGSISNNFVYGNYISFSALSAGTGIQLWSSNGQFNKIESNTIHNAYIGINVMAYGVNGTVLENNQFITCTNPIANSGANTIISNNTIIQ